MTCAQPKSKWKSLVGGLLLMSVLGIALLPIPNAMYAQAQTAAERDAAQQNALREGANTEAATPAETPKKCGDGFSGLLCNIVNGVGLLFSPGRWAGLILGVIADLFNGMFQVASSVTLGTTQALMNMPVSPSHPEVSPAVREGWKISRDLVNLLFLTLLVFIGLATILDLPGYAYKQSLPLFLVMVLLINFSGLLVGLMADIGNILTNFFLQSVRDQAWINMQIPSIKDIERVPEMTIIAKRLSEIMYYFVATFIFYAVVLVFFLRTFALWTLAIVAPFAFASYILPSTRGMVWNRWWKELIQWSLIGVPISFFMYLSTLVLGNSARPTSTSYALMDFMGPFTSLFLLFTGIAIAMEFVPKGAAGLVKHAQGTASSIKQWGKGKGREFLANRPNVQRAANYMATRQTLGAGQRGTLGAILRSASALPTGLMRWTGRQLGPNVIEAEKAAAAASQKAVEGKEAASQASAYQDATTEADRLGAIIAAHLAGNLNDVMGMIGKNVRRDLPNLLQAAQRTGKKSDLATAFPIEAAMSTADGGMDMSAEDVFRPLQRKPERFDQAASTIANTYATQPARSPQKKAAYALIEEMLKNGKPAHAQKLIEKADGREGIQALEGSLTTYYSTNQAGIDSRRTGAGLNAPSNLAQQRFAALEHLNPAFATWIRGNPGLLLLDIEDIP